MSLKIGDFAKACHVSVRMIRHYEEMGIIHPVRNSANYRLYRHDDIEKVKKVVLLNKVGLTLKDIALLHDCLCDKPQNFCDELKGKLNERVHAIENEVQALMHSQRLLKALLATQDTIDTNHG